MGAANLGNAKAFHGMSLTQGLPPMRLIRSSWVRPCRRHHAWSSSRSTGSGRSRNASSASCWYPRRRIESITYCLLYCIVITEPLHRSHAAVA